jgi:hypothetical protein
MQQSVMVKFKTGGKRTHVASIFLKIFNGYFCELNCVDEKI